MKILVIHSFGMGDMIMFTPALQELQKHFPKAQVDFLIFQHFSVQPIQNNDYVNSIYFSKIDLKSIFKIVYQVRQTHYDISFFTTGVKFYKSFFFNLLIKSKLKIVEYRNFYIPFFNTKFIKREKDKHFVINNLKIISIFCDINFNKKQTIKYWLKNEIVVKSNQKIIGIHPGCNIKFKQRRWHINNYIELIDKIFHNFSDYKIIIFIGPDEKEEAKILQKEFISHVEFIENKSLDDVAECISKCNIFISNDSGLGHIASCFKASILTIKSQSSDANLNTTAVYTDKNKIIEFKNSDKNQSETVFQELKKIIKCVE